MKALLSQYVPDSARGIDWARYGTGLVGAVLLILLLFKAGSVAFAVLVVAMQLLGLGEFRRLLHPRGLTTISPQDTIYVLLFSFIGYLGVYGLYPVLIYVATFTLFFQCMLRGKNLPHVAADISATLFTVLYIGFLPSMLIMLRSWLDGGVLGSCLIVWYLAVVMMGDTGAYLGGRRFGKHKLIPKLSPGKTWEGLAVGVALSCFIGFVMKWSALPSMPSWHVLPLVLVIQFTSHSGDIFISMLKRSAAVKDAGSFFPGHGGVLDRLDSVFMAGPVFFFYVLYFSPWAP